MFITHKLFMMTNILILLLLAFWPLIILLYYSYNQRKKKKQIKIKYVLVSIILQLIWAVYLLYQIGQGLVRLYTL